jgi:hypothetical protein
VLGAFRATPIRQLETEAYVPPLDLWLNGRVARFQAWLEKTGLVRQIRNACTAIKMQLRLQTRTRTRTRARTRNHQQAIDTLGTVRKQWAENWTGQPIEQWNEQEKRKVLEDWKERWKRERDRKGVERIVQPGTDLSSSSKAILKDTPLNEAVLKLHFRLRKAESSVLVQARTGRIGLAKFLYNCKVLGVLTAQCRCRAGEETPQHIALFCTDETERRRHLQVSGRLDY